MVTRTSRFNVNGKPVQIDVEPRTNLADALRHHLKAHGNACGL